MPDTLRKHDVLEWFEKKRLKPRVHGNGFVQVDIDERRRLHVWGHPDIPRQDVYHPIHDHVFGFESTVLVGRLVNVNYGKPLENNEGRFRLYQALPCKHGSADTKLALPGPEDRTHGLRYDFTPRRTDMVQAGETYSMERFDFHETVPVELSITMTVKSGLTLQQNPSGLRPYVAIPVDRQPDNHFNRGDYSRDLLMRILKEVWETRK